MLDDKVALVTGSGRGIGRAIALTLAQRGANVVVNDIHLENALQVVEEIKVLGRQSIAIKADVSNEEEVNKMVKTSVDTFGKIDILVNNAAICSGKLLVETSVQDWDLMLNISLKSVFLCTKAVFPLMMEQKSGKIVNIASLAGKVGGGSFAKSAYSAAKGGVIAFTKAIAREGGAYGINVNAVTPGMVDTEMIKGLADSEWAAYLRAIPLGRAGKPVDIAKAVCFLASSESDYVTGEIMDVNGGVMMD